MIGSDAAAVAIQGRPRPPGGLRTRSAELSPRAVERLAELLATAAGRSLFKRALPLWAEAEQDVRAAMGSKLTADLHGALDRSMEKLATL